MSRRDIENPMVLERADYSRPEKTEDPYTEKPRTSSGWMHPEWTAALAKFQPVPMVLDTGVSGRSALDPRLTKMRGGKQHGRR